MQRWLVRSAKRVLDGAFALRFSHAGRVVYYHSVHPETPLSHRPEQFRAQLRWLRENGYRDVLLRDIPSVVHDRAPQRYVCITFDDGYRDNVEHALPVLQEEGFRATFFIVAGIVAARPMSSNEGNMLYGDRLMMSEDDVRALSRAGMEVASHNWTHRQATDILRREGYGALVRELRRSKARLEELTGGEVTSFAYPNGQLGSRSATTARAVQAAGYTAGATTLWSAMAPGHPLEIGRCEMASDDSLQEFEAKMTGGRDWRVLANRLVDRSSVWYATRA